MRKLATMQRLRNAREIKISNVNGPYIEISA